MGAPFIPLQIGARVAPMTQIQPIVPMTPMAPQTPPVLPGAGVFIPLLPTTDTPPAPPAYTGPGSTPERPFPLYGERGGIPYAEPRGLPVWVPAVGAGVVAFGLGVGLLWFLRR